MTGNQQPLRLAERCFFCGEVMDEREPAILYVKGSGQNHAAHHACAEREALRILQQIHAQYEEKS